MSVLSSVNSLRLDRFVGSPFPLLRDSAPVTARIDQLQERGESGSTQHVISADIHSVPRSVSAFDPSSLLFPFSDSGLSSLPPSTPSLPSFSSSVSASSLSSTVPLFSLPSVVPSVLSTPYVPFPPPSSFSQFPSSFPSFSFLRLLLGLVFLFAHARPRETRCILHSR